eukprot:MONOS_4289.1-p1 / transcript=MONOS_4289.1 / gene=MONOS_4289 / organism=Monocercomonoides_exilis_PA203 / gene_product=unspecified product / transcript_product=unspecified product / location=Mono_scaffold00112:57331-63609(+) / protein_length=2093 / sequence_SO=supercontig / SO=protein_coding / is_pseudo=false
MRLADAFSSRVQSQMRIQQNSPVKMAVSSAVPNIKHPNSFDLGYSFGKQLDADTFNLSEMKVCSLTPFQPRCIYVLTSSSLSGWSLDEGSLTLIPKLSLTRYAVKMDDGKKERTRKIFKSDLFDEERNRRNSMMKKSSMELEELKKDLRKIVRYSESEEEEKEEKEEEDIDEYEYRKGFSCSEQNQNWDDMQQQENIPSAVFYTAPPIKQPLASSAQHLFEVPLENALRRTLLNADSELKHIPFCISLLDLSLERERKSESLIRDEEEERRKEKEIERERRLQRIKSERQRRGRNEGRIKAHQIRNTKMKRRTKEEEEEEGNGRWHSREREESADASESSEEDTFSDEESTEAEKQNSSESDDFCSEWSDSSEEEATPNKNAKSNSSFATGLSAFTSLVKKIKQLSHRSSASSSCSSSSSSTSSQKQPHSQSTHANPPKVPEALQKWRSKPFRERAEPQTAHVLFSITPTVAVEGASMMREFYVVSIANDDLFAASNSSSLAEAIEYSKGRKIVQLENVDFEEKSKKGADSSDGFSIIPFLFSSQILKLNYTEQICDEHKQQAPLNNTALSSSSSCSSSSSLLSSASSSPTLSSSFNMNTENISPASNLITSNADSAALPSSMSSSSSSSLSSPSPCSSSQHLAVPSSPSESVVDALTPHTDYLIATDSSLDRYSNDAQSVCGSLSSYSSSSSSSSFSSSSSSLCSSSLSNVSSSSNVCNSVCNLSTEPNASSRSRTFTFGKRPLSLLMPEISARLLSHGFSQPQQLRSEISAFNSSVLLLASSPSLPESPFSGGLWSGCGDAIGTSLISSSSTSSFSSSSLLPSYSPLRSLSLTFSSDCPLFSGYAVSVPSSFLRAGNSRNESKTVCERLLEAVSEMKKKALLCSLFPRSEIKNSAKKEDLMDSSDSSSKRNSKSYEKECDTTNAKEEEEDNNETETLHFLLCLPFGMLIYRPNDKDLSSYQIASSALPPASCNSTSRTFLSPSVTLSALPILNSLTSEKAQSTAVHPQFPRLIGQLNEPSTNTDESAVKRRLVKQRSDSFVQSQPLKTVISLSSPVLSGSEEANVSIELPLLRDVDYSSLYAACSSSTLTFKEWAVSALLVLRQAFFAVSLQRQGEAEKILSSFFFHLFLPSSDSLALFESALSSDTDPRKSIAESHFSSSSSSLSLRQRSSHTSINNSFFTDALVNALSVSFCGLPSLHLIDFTSIPPSLKQYLDPRSDLCCFENPQNAVKFLSVLLPLLLFHLLNLVVNTADADTSSASSSSTSSSTASPSVSIDTTDSFMLSSPSSSSSSSSSSATISSSVVPFHSSNELISYRSTHQPFEQTAKNTLSNTLRHSLALIRHKLQLLEHFISFLSVPFYFDCSSLSSSSSSSFPLLSSTKLLAFLSFSHRLKLQQTTEKLQMFLVLGNCVVKSFEFVEAKKEEESRKKEELRKKQDQHFFLSRRIVPGENFVFGSTSSSSLSSPFLFSPSSSSSFSSPSSSSLNASSTQQAMSKSNEIGFLNGSVAVGKCSFEEAEHIVLCRLFSICVKCALQLSSDQKFSKNSSNTISKGDFEATISEVDWVKMFEQFFLNEQNVVEFICPLACCVGTASQMVNDSCASQSFESDKENEKMIASSPSSSLSSSSSEISSVPSDNFKSLFSSSTSLKRTKTLFRSALLQLSSDLKLPLSEVVALTSLCCSRLGAAVCSQSEKFRRASICEDQWWNSEQFHLSFDSKKNVSTSLSLQQTDSAIDIQNPISEAKLEEEELSLPFCISKNASLLNKMWNTQEFSVQELCMLCEAFAVFMRRGSNQFSFPSLTQGNTSSCSSVLMNDSQHSQVLNSIHLQKFSCLRADFEILVNFCLHSVLNRFTSHSIQKGLFVSDSERQQLLSESTFSALRSRLLLPLKEAKQYNTVIRLSVRYCDKQLLYECCTLLHDEDLLIQFMMPGNGKHQEKETPLRKVGLVQYVLSRWLISGRVYSLLHLPEQLKEELDAFLRDHPDLHWIYLVQEKEWSEAEKTLQTLSAIDQKLHCNGYDPNTETSFVTEPTSNLKNVVPNQNATMLSDAVSQEKRLLYLSLTKLSLITNENCETSDIEIVDKTIEQTLSEM